ncbi:MAG: DUF5686 family protein [Bacteroidales bacterium]|nr:DUF5686 family protein [Bacteroidales bacterium]
MAIKTKSIVGFKTCACCMLLCLCPLLAWATDSIAQQHIVAERVMRLTYTFAARKQLSVGSYEARAYVRTSVDTHRRNGLMRYVPGYFALERGRRQYVNEMELALSYRYPNLLDRKVVASYGNVPRDIQQRERLMEHFVLTPYGETLWRAFALSPFHRKNARYYHYRLDSLSADSVGQLWAYMRVEPKVENTQLVRGQAVIQAHTGAVRSMRFQVYYDLTRVRLDAELGTTPSEALLPKRVRVDTRLNFMGNRVTTSSEAFCTYTHVISRPDLILDEADRSADTAQSRFDYSHVFAHQLDTTAMVECLTHFDSLRPLPLPDTLRHKPVSRASSMLAVPRRRTFWQGLEDVLLDGARFRWHNASGMPVAEVRLPRVINPEGIRWSHSRGLFVLTKWRAYWQLTPTMRLQSTARLGYNFREHEWQSIVPLVWEIDTRYRLRLNVEVGKYNNLYNTRQFREVLQPLHPHMPYDTLMRMINRYPYNLYRNYQARLALSGDLVPGLTLGGGIHYYHRVLKHYDATAASYGLHSHHRALVLSAKTTFTPGLHYYRDATHRHDLYSLWPTLFLSYEHSVRTAYLRAGYARIEGSVSYRYRLNAVKSVYLRLGGGGFTKRRESYFADFEFFNNNPLRDQLDDDMMGRFQLLDARWYNLSSYYAQASTAYESPMLLMSRLGSLSRLIHTERLYANVLCSSLLRPYVEVGYGIRTPVLDIGLFVSGAHGKQLSAGISFEYRLFDGWGR